MLFDKIRNFGEKIALINETKSVSYKQIFLKSKYLNKVIKKNKLILIICKNEIEIIFYYIAFTLNRSPLILVDSKTQKSEINSIIKKYKPEYICSAEQTLNQLELFNNNLLDKIENAIIIKNKNPKKYKINKHLFLLLSTSGTTGSSKYVRLSFKNIIDNTIKINEYLKIKKTDVAVTNMPFAYSYMLSIINTHIHFGASILVTEKSILDREFWKIYKKFKVSSFNGVPYIFEILEKIELKKIFNKNLRYITQAGGNLDLEIKKKIIKFFKNKLIPFYIMYGQTEASPRISFFDAIKNEKKISSIGKPLRGYKIFVKSTGGKIIREPFQKGILNVVGNNICLGYAKSFLDLKKGDKNKKKISTDDLGYFDNNGYYYITGRNNRVEKVLGNRIDLNDIDLKLKKKKFNIYSKIDNNRLFIYYTNKYNKNLLLSEIRKISNLNSNLIILKKIKKFIFNFNGKININKLN